MYNKELIIDFLEYPEHVNDGVALCYFGNNSYYTHDFKMVRIKPENIIQMYIYTNLITDNTHFYVGCFDSDNGCESIGSYEFYLYLNSLTIFINKESRNNWGEV